jgi:hypothetical protein
MFYKKLATALKSYGFEYNPYDPCVANKVVGGKVLTLCHHVDDCKISHVDTKVVDETISLLKGDFEIMFEDGSGAMQVHRGKIHVYVGMTLNYEYSGEVRVSMINYVQEVIEAFNKAKLKFNEGFVEVKPKKRSRSSSQITAAPKNLFVVNEECEKLNDTDRESLHSIVQKMLYVAKRARPDTMTAMSFLTKRVKNPDQDEGRPVQAGVHGTVFGVDVEVAANTKRR